MISRRKCCFNLQWIYIETSPFIWSENQRTGFYMTGTFVVKELINEKIRNHQCMKKTISSYKQKYLSFISFNMISLCFIKYTLLHLSLKILFQNKVLHTSPDRENKAFLSIFGMTSRLEIMMSLLFLQFMADLRKSRNQIMEVWSKVLNFSSIMTCCSTKAEKSLNKFHIIALKKVLLLPKNADISRNLSS